MQNTVSRRTREQATPRVDWRSHPGMLASTPSHSNTGRPQVAVVLVIGSSDATKVTSALAKMGIPTMARAFDAEAPRIVAAMSPSLVVVVCQPMREPDAEAIRLLSQQATAQLLVVDCGHHDEGLTRALDSGADQVISSFAEMTTIRATLQAILRRSSRGADFRPGGQSIVASVGALTVDNDTFEIRDGGDLVHLTATEFRIVSYLALNVGQVRTAGQIMSAVRDYTVTNVQSGPTLRAYVRRIRQKLANSENPSVEIVSFRLKGYRLQSSTSAGSPVQRVANAPVQSEECGVLPQN